MKIYIIEMPSGVHAGTCIIGEGTTKANAWEDAYGPDWKRNKSRSANCREVDSEDPLYDQIASHLSTPQPVSKSAKYNTPSAAPESESEPEPQPEPQPDPMDEPVFDPYRFVLAGNAVFTVVSIKTGKRFTYKVFRPSDAKSDCPYFVSVLTGPDNTQDFTYLGCIFDKKRYAHGRKSTIDPWAPSNRAIDWVLNKFVLALQFLPADQVEIHHEGRCGCCGRTLTVPSSIVTGLGPVCASKLDVF